MVLRLHQPFPHRGVDDVRPPLVPAAITNCSTSAKIAKISVRRRGPKSSNAVNQGRLTMQTMIFEPGPLLLHVSCGPPPSSKQPLHDIPPRGCRSGKKGIGD